MVVWISLFVYQTGVLETVFKVNRSEPTLVFDDKHFETTRNSTKIKASKEVLYSTVCRDGEN